MIYWLDKKGAEIIASLEGVPLKEFPWRNEPRWFQVEHDLAVNDFRLDLEEACQVDPRINLETWVPESEFWSYPDKVDLPDVDINPIGEALHDLRPGYRRKCQVNPAPDKVASELACLPEEPVFCSR